MDRVSFQARNRVSGDGIISDEAEEAISFGLGVSFLIFGYPQVQRVMPHSKGLATAAYLSITWLLIEWWPHDNLHYHTGTHLGPLLVIEYALHVTLMIAGAVLAYFFFQLAKQNYEGTK